jgi:hypothetical protein
MNPEGKKMLRYSEIDLKIKSNILQNRLRRLEFEESRSK